MWAREKRYSERTIATYVSYVERAAAVLDLETATLAELTDWWRTIEDTAASRNQARKALIAAFKSMGRKRGEPADELEAQPEQDRPPRPVTDETFAALIAAAHLLGGAHEAAGMLLAGTGCRITEARTARWDAFELEAASPVWRIRGKGSGRKGAKERVVPLSAPLAAVLTRWRGECGSRVFVFPTRHGAGSGMIGDSKMRALVHDLSEVAGVEQVGAHRYRHTVATLALDRSGNLAGVQDLLGHADPATTRRYAKVSPDRLRSIVNALPT